MRNYLQIFINMKNRKLINTLLLMIVMLFTGGRLIATNIQVSDIVIVERNDADRYIIVQFNLRWDYSFRVEDGDNTNWDAAWVFMKYKKTTDANVPWGHATLGSTGHTVPGNFTSSAGVTGGVNKGLFVYPSVVFANTAQINGMRLRWDYGDDGLLPEDEVDIRVFGTEMVYVPAGAFYVGSGGAENDRFIAGGSLNDPFRVTDASFQVSNSAGNLWAAGNRVTGSFAPGYPTGFNAFYMMKHNITQQAYADFLNTLTYEQQDLRIDGSPGDAAGTFTNNLNRHKIKIAAPGTAGSAPAEYATDNPWVPANFMSPADLLSYLDWAALRPFTELEYEKAARGPASPVANEYAWGNTRIGNVTAISDPGLATEAPVSDGYQRDITIDHTRVNEDLTDFPILVRLTADNFNFSQCRPDGFDLRFYNSGGDPLSYQRERHDFDAKKAEYWVKVPAISASQNTVITMEYGLLAADDGADPANVWDDNLISLWHLDESASGTADDYADSKGGNDGQATGSFASGAEGRAGLAQEFDGEGAISVPYDATLDAGEFVTVSGWIKPQTLAGASLSESSAAHWNDNYSMNNLTVAGDALIVSSHLSPGTRISSPIALDAIKKAGSSVIDWEDEPGYSIAAFTTDGKFSVPPGVSEVSVLVVGGGGGGGRSATPNASGGGGAGALVWEEVYGVTPGALINVTVGNGGTAGSGSSTAATPGGSSSFGPLVAAGGGRGGQNDTGLYDGGDGGSGGGSASTGGAGGSGTAGMDGGSGQSAAGGGAGGGGAGSAGGNASGNNGANGGAGLDFSSWFGTVWGDEGWFAGGGGGGAMNDVDVAGTGGKGGGGSAALVSADVPHAMANTGGGGGAGQAESANAEGGNGGSGIVLVRYKDPQSVRVYTAVTNDLVNPPDFDLNVQVFTGNGTFSVPEGITSVDVLVVAGGGGGSGSVSGGGGGGGLIWQEGFGVTPGSDINVVIGAGGTGGATNSPGTSGQNSLFGTLEAIGGGHGAGAGTVNTLAGDGGSGGGGARYNDTGFSSGGAATAGQGYGGGNATAGNNTFAGGGGAGGVGQSVATGAGNGGMGRDFSNIFGTLVGDNGWFSGGGGGASNSGIAGSGGTGGGGNGASGSDNAVGGMPNTGGGGGGAYAYAGGTGGSGGSGVVIVRWGRASKGEPVPGINIGDDMSGKFLWVKQELSTNNPTFSPELQSLNIEIKGEAIIAGKGEDAYQLSYYDGNLRGYINNQMVSSALTTDEYQHVAVTYNGAFQRIYVNGLLTSTRTLSGNIGTNGDDFLMGLNLIGALDEIRVSRTSRSQAWLKAEFHSGVGDLVQLGGEGQNNNAVYGNSNFGAGIGQGPLRVGFGASATSSRTASGASYWGIMELSGNLWERLISAGSVTGRTFTGQHGDGILNGTGTFDVPGWPSEFVNRGGAYHHTNFNNLRISDRNSTNWSATWGNRAHWQSGRGVRSAP